jgi:hypothetical protein
MSRVPNNEANAGKCVCAGCPSYDDCMKSGSERLYCAVGGSGCEVNRTGCICGACPLSAEYNLGDLYYCIGGAA